MLLYKPNSGIDFQIFIQKGISQEVYVKENMIYKVSCIQNLSKKIEKLNYIVHVKEIKK